MDSQPSAANAGLLTRFYKAFAALDADTMAGCYTRDAQFRDEVFTLHGREEIAAMWRMLCEATKAKGRDAWSLKYSRIDTEAAHGSAHWEANYRFSATGRLVHNSIDAQFEFREGLILGHRDSFNFHAWSRQALGLPGLLLGWTPFLRRKVQERAAANLHAFRRKG